MVFIRKEFLKALVKRFYGRLKLRILGIDPGYAIVGFGIVEYDGYQFTPITYGAITTEAHTSYNYRLRDIYKDMTDLINTYSPDEMAIEKLFFNTNQKTVIDVSQARGVILLSAVNLDIPISEYTPLQVKQSVVGYGRAEKKQVMDMTKQILKLKAIPKPDDAADALALAICHGHSSKIPK
jgi:crossover junction endodeoxyribonuclease RuvC